MHSRPYCPICTAIKYSDKTYDNLTVGIINSNLGFVITFAADLVGMPTEIPAVSSGLDPEEHSGEADPHDAVCGYHILINANTTQ